MERQQDPTSSDQTSYLVQRSSPDIEGFCKEYPLRRHRFEDESNKGALQCRGDWVEFIGPIERWGCCNPWEGNFAAVVLPFCKPERLAIISYILEYAFMYDNVVESAAKSTLNINADNIGLDETEYRTVRSTLGSKQIQSKMIIELLSIDKLCAEVVIDVWKTMIATTAKLDKARPFSSLEEYVDYRIIDTGAPFVDALMRFGMGIRLTSEEENRLAPIVKPCYAALGLANDYLSFDVEWQEFQSASSGKRTMTNLVWLFMQWDQVDVQEAKRRVREVTNQYEDEYRERMEAFLAKDGRGNDKLKIYLHALGHQIPGNVAWSLRCPRYHPELCDDASALLERGRKESKGEAKDQETAHDIPADDSARRPSESDDSCSASSSIWSVSKRSSISSAPSDNSEPWSLEQVKLGDEHLLAPAEYISSLPSKGVREAFVDALNVWVMLPDRTVAQLKSIAQTLHNASLMLDDIEDSSPLRRGRPATHTVFGVGQTTNSANFLLIQAADQVRQLGDSRCMDIFMEEMRLLFRGQSFDLYWTRQGECPSEEEYLVMIRNKTGGLFRLIARLMAQKDPFQNHSLHTSLESLAGQLGEYFQIRDDYKNLTEEYTGQKGFCEDLDEGKFSFPLIHALFSRPKNLQLRGILQQSRISGGLDISLKECALHHIREAGSMEYTEKTLSVLMDRIDDSLRSLERQNGRLNWILRLLLHRLKV
ncbi:fusicoccadiene synthase [Aspergillus lentulus]|uniref:bifunctional terpene synthase/polyprenyl synthetase family protein n=1 Tax=Aspergillus lentulus TaxID=293939 RepID=UPI001394263B|nr:fusicoccadiene synthase [Aspergillus lentulus]GFF26184.1 fusicoccadiene synthase [Aspergillus lentulus]GFG01240.1 fusicoccadiene synthase [Aspergillus lentulus]